MSKKSCPFIYNELLYKKTDKTSWTYSIDNNMTDKTDNNFVFISIIDNMNWSIKTDRLWIDVSV